MDQIGGVLKEARKRANLNQEELGFRLHIDQAVISKIEANKRAPSLETFRAWITQTNSQEYAIAFLLGADSLPMIQQVMEALSGVVAFVSLLGGIM